MGRRVSKHLSVISFCFIFVFITKSSNIFFSLFLPKMPRQYNLKYISLISLILQTTCVVLLLRYSRTKQIEPYVSSTAIVASEFIKGIICVILVWFENGIIIKETNKYLLNKKKNVYLFRLFI